MVLIFLKITMISLTTNTTSIQAIYLAFNIWGHGGVGGGGGERTPEPPLDPPLGRFTSNMPAHGILLLIANAQNAHAEESSGTRGLNFSLSLHLHPYFVSASNEGFCESAHSPFSNGPCNYTIILAPPTPYR